jgi:hypothetical protein
MTWQGDRERRGGVAYQHVRGRSLTEAAIHLGEGVVVISQRILSERRSDAAARRLVVRGIAPRAAIGRRSTIMSVARPAYRGGFWRSEMAVVVLMVVTSVLVAGPCKRAWGILGGATTLQAAEIAVQSIVRQ